MMRLHEIVIFGKFAKIDYTVSARLRQFQNTLGRIAANGLGVLVRTECRQADYLKIRRQLSDWFMNCLKKSASETVSVLVGSYAVFLRKKFYKMAL